MTSRHLPQRLGTPGRCAGTPLVLVIEDDEDSRLVLGDVFRHAGYEVELVPDGERGLAIAWAPRRPDLIVLDLMLPSFGGLHVLERLRCDPLTRAVPIVVFTAHGEGPEAARARRAPRVTVIGKPAPPLTVLDTVQRLLAAGGPSEAVATSHLRTGGGSLLVDRYLQTLPTRFAELEERCRIWRGNSLLKPPSLLARRLVGSAGLHALERLADRARDVADRLQDLESGSYHPTVAVTFLNGLRGAVQQVAPALGRRAVSGRRPEMLG